MKTAVSASLLALLCLPVVAGAPKGRHRPPAAPIAPAATVTDALNQVAGKNQIVGITETSGVRFLGRVIAGDHGLYVVQTFHFAGPPNVRTEPTTRVVGSGKKRHTVNGTTRVYTDTAIPDEEAVKLLLAGVAGATTTPRELAGPRAMLSPADVKFIQALSPPIAPKMPKGPAGQSVLVSPTAAKQLGWRITSVWPAAKTDASTPDAPPTSSTP